MTAAPLLIYGVIAALYTFYAESEIFLRQIAERNDDDRREDLGDRRIDMKLLDEELDKDVVQQQADQYQHKIPEQLHPAMECRSRKYDIPVQKKTQRETDAERDHDGGNIGRDDYRPQAYIMMTQNIIVCYGISDNIDQCSRTATSRIPEGLQRHQPAEWRVKKINKIDNPLLYHRVVLLSAKDNYKM